ncbi:Uma2 family endonuclease [Phormidium sp. CLA17]|uniref:Uma2 family endonuclease n=1 Tax=Leptolyngbya sp. Cla-17 TaxID=2803751 RepID=UPI001491B04C|nr:Uma2 family endonuclease [Leptolyngbya sp. Cla-17]MBM0743459.1 Uma2 family endonuclease [Leptolyngbya sp. Cla-17]
MVQTPEKTVSLEEFLQRPVTKPASEYINGKIIQKPIPQGHHSTIQIELGSFINTTLKSQKLARAYTELRCTFGGRSTVPDVTVFLQERIPREPDGRVANVFPIPPDWTIEILSPDQRTTRVTLNILYCLEHGTQLGWLIDPEESLILIYSPGQQVEAFEDPTAVLPVPAFAAGLTLTLGEVFGWLLE